MLDKKCKFNVTEYESEIKRIPKLRWTTFKVPKDDKASGLGEEMEIKGEKLKMFEGNCREIEQSLTWKTLQWTFVS
jgi:hypothetical protein